MAINWIAKRALSAPNRDNVIVHLGAPESVSREEWQCPYSVSTTRAKRVQYARGLDAVQALLMALVAVRAALDGMGTSFEWAGGELGDTGFPRVVPQFFGLEFSRRIDGLIDHEVKEYSARAKQQSEASATSSERSGGGKRGKRSQH